MLALLWHCRLLVLCLLLLCMPTHPVRVAHVGGVSYLSSGNRNGNSPSLSGRQQKEAHFRAMSMEIQRLQRERKQQILQHGNDSRVDEGAGSSSSLSRFRSSHGADLSSSSASVSTSAAFGKPNDHGVSKRCMVCEDVAETFRSTFPCVGHTDSVWTPNEALDVQPCRTPFRCGLLQGQNPRQTASLRDTCFKMAKDIFDPSSSTKLFSQISAFLRSAGEGPGRQSRRADGSDYRKNSLSRLHDDYPDPAHYSGPVIPAEYEICYQLEDKDKLKMCPDDWRDKDTTCPAELGSAECRDDPTCSNLLFNGTCTEKCYICYWLVKSFPVFEEMCSKFEKGKPESSVKEQSGTEWDVVKAERNGRQKEQEGLGSPKLKKEAAKPGDALKDCMNMWTEFILSPKARFLIQYADNFGNHPWNANTACKCLGKCAYNSYESMDLATQCVYEDNADRAYNLFPDIPSFMADVASPLVSGAQYDPDKLRRTPLWPGGALQRHVVGDGTKKMPNGAVRQEGADADDVYTSWDNTGIVLGEGKAKRTDLAGEPGLHEIWNPVGGVQTGVGGKKPAAGYGVNVPPK